MTNWTKVDDALPPLKKSYEDATYDTSGWMLVYTGHYVTSGKYEGTYARNKMRWISQFNRTIEVTHWMPYPDAPTDGVKP